MIPLRVTDKVVNDYFYIIKDNLLKRINTIIQTNCIKKGKKKTTIINLSPSLKVFLLTFLQGNSLENLITGDLTYLKSQIRFYRIHNQSFFVKTEDDYKILYNIFVDHGYEKISKFDFIKKIEINTCPYCNRNYILYSNNKKIVKPEIDHFFPKGIYPLLAVSFYNLIPCCQSCNGYFGKHEKDSFLISLKSPYELNSDDFVFSYKINNISIINPLIGKSSVDVLLKTKCLKNSEIFNLEKYYQMHQDHVLELIIKSKTKYSDAYKNSLLKLSKYQLSKSEIDRMIIGNYSLEKEQHKRPLSKMYQDIGKELGLIKK